MNSKMHYRFKTGLGQNSHRFLSEDISKPCIIGGVIFEGVPGFNANSDGDVIYHAICNAISSVTGILILGAIADELCLRDGITDSEVYLREAVKTLERWEIVHAAISLEGKRPRMREQLLPMRRNIAAVLATREEDVGITVTSGEGLTDFGCGDGVQCFAILTFMREE